MAPFYTIVNKYQLIALIKTNSQLQSSDCIPDSVQIDSYFHFKDKISVFLHSGIVYRVSRVSSLTGNRGKENNDSTIKEHHFLWF